MDPIRVTRTELVEVLERWRAGELTPAAVHAWASTRFRPGDNEFDDETPEGDSVANVVLGHLDSLDMHLVTPEDVPAYLTFLAAPAERFPEAYATWRAAVEAVDYPQRRRALCNDPLYAPFC